MIVSRTFRHRNEHGKQQESRTHSQGHKYDGHKQAAMVNLAHLERNAGQIGTRRSGRNKQS